MNRLADLPWIPTIPELNDGQYYTGSPTTKDEKLVTQGAQRPRTNSRQQREPNDQGIQLSWQHRDPLGYVVRRSTRCVRAHLLEWVQKLCVLDTARLRHGTDKAHVTAFQSDTKAAVSVRADRFSSQSHFPWESYGSAPYVRYSHCNYSGKPAKNSV